MRPVRLALAGLATVVAQSTLVPLVRIGSTGPDLPLVLVVYIGMFHGPLAAAVTGAVLGLALDALSLAPVGLNALTKCGGGALAGLLALRLFPEHRAPQILTVGVATVLQEVVFLISARVLLDVEAPVTHPLLNPLVQAVWGALAAWIFMPVFSFGLRLKGSQHAFQTSASVEI